jgi:hypothetical protein
MRVLFAFAVAAALLLSILPRSLRSPCGCCSGAEEATCETDGCGCSLEALGADELADAAGCCASASSDACDASDEAIDGPVLSSCTCGGRDPGVVPGARVPLFLHSEGEPAPDVESDGRRCVEVGLDAPGSWVSAPEPPVPRRGVALPYEPFGTEASLRPRARS